MLKKSLPLMFALLMSVSFCSCGNNNSSKAPDTLPQAKPATSTPEPAKSNITNNLQQPPKNNIFTSTKMQMTLKFPLAWANKFYCTEGNDIVEVFHKSALTGSEQSARLFSVQVFATKEAYSVAKNQMKDAGSLIAGVSANNKYYAYTKGIGNSGKTDVKLVNGQYVATEVTFKPYKNEQATQEYDALLKDVDSIVKGLQ